MKGVTKGKELPPRIVLYGPPKFGKSTFGSQAPSPIFVPTEDGVNNIQVDQFPRQTTWDELLATLKRLVDEAHDYKTLVLDTLNGAVELAAQHVCLTKFGGDWGKGGYAAFGQGVMATSEEIRKLLVALDAIRDKGMWVLLLAHTGVQIVRSPVEGEYSKFTPEMDRKVWARFAAWADIIIRGDYEFLVKKSDSPLRPGRAVGDTTRVLRCAGTAAEDAGARVGWELPESIPFSRETAWSDFMAALGKDTSLITEAAELLKKAPKDKVEAAYTWLGTRDLSKAPVGKLRDLVTKLRTLKEEKNG